jgi:hypothetical protein
MKNAPGPILAWPTQLTPSPRARTNTASPLVTLALLRSPAHCVRARALALPNLWGPRVGHQCRTCSLLLGPSCHPARVSSTDAEIAGRSWATERPIHVRRTPRSRAA